MADYHENIRKEMNKILESLESKFNITIEEIKEINFGIQYKASDGKSCEYINVFNSFKMTGRQNQDNRLLNIIEKEFSLRDCVKKTENKYSDLDNYYNVLKKYRDDQIDYSVFANKLFEYCDEDDKKLLKDEINNFNVLEDIYFKIKENK